MHCWEIRTAHCGCAYRLRLWVLVMVGAKWWESSLLLPVNHLSLEPKPMTEESTRRETTSDYSAISWRKLVFSQPGELNMPLIYFLYGPVCLLHTSAWYWAVSCVAFGQNKRHKASSGSGSLVSGQQEKIGVESTGQLPHVFVARVHECK